ncbi:DEAD/DEAH box helicase [Paenibacillus alkaliterrae]|uniref:DEAD/DEAH box helicase n=1 Tax=Paenibacillus alkaliterrae TaxID=320909 RepID=UPI001F3E71B6|nr:DEAD/DEAH box helicase [Paenibacillus alkaliterrae]MCF2941537.1 DEAD/DEAH box helicase [Paenibacillus alkaliterrae]
MSKHLDTITVQANLTAYGDALIYGYKDEERYLFGFYLKQRLFARHEASFYGTELEVQQAQGLEAVLLPADQVISFFAEGKLLEHLEWIWGEQAAELVQLAPQLAACIEERLYIPSYRAFQAGQLEWSWDESALDGPLRDLLGQANASFIEGLNAAFSAAVYRRHYGTESTAADLRREYPLLFTKDHMAMTGLDAQEWLIAVGWKSDTAPFRPVLQLLEPEDAEPAWRLKLVLQDKRDQATLAPVRLTGTGEALGSWPAEWSAHVSSRSAGWLERLRACLPQERLAGLNEDVLSSPLSDEAAWRFLSADSKRLLEAGWQVLLPAWWEAASRKKPRLRAKVSSDTGSGAGGSLFGLDSLVDFDWRIAIGDTDLTEAEFAQLVARNERLVRFRGQWIALDPALLAQIRKAMASVDSSQGLSFQDVLQLHLLGNSDGAESVQDDQSTENEARIRLEVELNGHLMKLISQLGQQTEWPKLAVPAGLKAELRSYQQDGYAWLAFLRRFGLGACLADDMGLGKTVQLIAYLLHLQETAARPDGGAPSLIICPTSVLGNWQKELHRFAPSLRVMLHYGNKRFSGEEFAAATLQADVILTSYATATLDQELLQAYTWASISLDEAQNIKNAQTKQSAAVRSLSARHRVALTGTPIENRLSELWSIYDFINPGYLGSSHAFANRFANAIEKEQDAGRTADLQRLVKPFMLRRKKKDPAIQLDLPDKNEMKTYIHLTAEQGALYNQTVNQLMERMQALEGIERKGAILAALTQLKQLCDHPILLTKEAVAEVTSAAADVLETETLVSRSSKLERLLAMVRELRDEGDRCLIFTQYIGMGQLLQRVLQQELQEPVLYLNGSTSKSARDRMIEQFQSTAQPPAEQPGVFILSIKAGGVGLNLTAANHVFHFDRWWNPAVENQATDRAYRMGQTRDVQVHKFISLGTLEERIDEMLDNKQQLSDNVITSSEGWITELSTEALKDLFTLRQQF